MHRAIVDYALVRRHSGDTPSKPCRGRFVKTLTENDFLVWAKGKGLGLDPQYPDSAVLDFQGGSDARFWNVPQQPDRRPYLIASLLALMGDWKTAYAWRHLGSWPHQNAADAERMNDVVQARILKGLDMPLGTADVVAFDHRELDTLIALLFTTTVFGWSVGEDLYVVPDHARQILQTDHHGVIHISFRDAGDVAHWVTEMAERGFNLPDELLDETFKRPSWMPE